MSARQRNKRNESDESEKLRFFTNISHEFRTPLTLILGPLERLLSEDQQMDEPERKKIYTLMHRNALRLLRLINQLMDTSKLDSGNLKLAVSEGDIITYINPIVQSFNYLAETRQLDYRFYFKPSSIKGYFDRDKIEKITYNLLSNAFKYTNEGGKISVHLKEEYQNINQKKRRCLRIIVRDNGVGIPQEHLEKIFNPYYQVDKTMFAKRAGTGLGLSLTQRLAELHKGNIHVDSMLNRGTTFSLIIPIDKELYSEEEIVEELDNELDHVLNLALTQDYSPKHNELIKKRIISEEIPDDKNIILILDDSDDIREYIHEELSGSHFVIEASDGRSGYELAKKFVPDIIVSDIMMPEMDGTELTKRLKSNNATSHIPVILLTSRSKDEHILEGLEVGAQDYITKPFNSKFLKLRIDNILQARKKLQERNLASNNEIETNVTQNNESRFLLEFRNIILENIEESDLSVDYIAEMLTVSRSQLFRKVKALTGQGPSDIIKKIKLNEALKLIKENNISISEIAYKSGFNDPKYFSKSFKKEFGESPSHYLKNS